MAIIKKQVGFTIEIDEEAISPMGVETWIYMIINRLNYEHDITSVTIDGVTVETDPSGKIELPANKDI